MSGTLVDTSVYRNLQPLPPVNPFGMAQQAGSALYGLSQGMLGMMRAKFMQAIGPMYQAAMGPDGTVDPVKLAPMMAAHPDTGMFLPEVIQSLADIDQTKAHAALYGVHAALERFNWISSSASALSAEAGAGGVPYQSVADRVGEGVKTGVLPATMASDYLGQFRKPDGTYQDPMDIKGHLDVLAKTAQGAAANIQQNLPSVQWQPRVTGAGEPGVGAVAQPGPQQVAKGAVPQPLGQTFATGPGPVGAGVNEYISGLSAERPALQRQNTFFNDALAALPLMRAGGGAAVRTELAKRLQGLGAPASLVNAVQGGDYSVALPAAQIWMKNEVLSAGTTLADTIGKSRIAQREWTDVRQNFMNMDSDPTALEHVVRKMVQVNNARLDEPKWFQRYAGRPGVTLDSWPSYYDAARQKAGLGTMDPKALGEELRRNAGKRGVEEKKAGALQQIQTGGTQPSAQPSAAPPVAPTLRNPLVVPGVVPGLPIVPGSGAGNSLLNPPVPGGLMGGVGILP